MMIMMMIIRPINLGSGTDMIDIADTSNKAKETPTLLIAEQ